MRLSIFMPLVVLPAPMPPLGDYDDGETILNFPVILEDYAVTLKQPIIAAQGGAKMEVTVEKGKAYFVEVTGVSEYVPRVYIRTGSGIALAPAEHAISIIKKCCKFQAPK